MLIPIDKIKISPDRRKTVPAQVEKLAQSISELGLLNSITIDQDNTLIAGLHRIEAAKRLGWTEIECNVTSLAGLQAKLAEIDENIVRCDFSSMESNELLLRRKEIYESLHPETQQGKRNRMTSKNEDFFVFRGKAFCSGHSGEVRRFASNCGKKAQNCPRPYARSKENSNGPRY